MDDDIDNATIAYANNGSKIPSSYTYTPINHPGAVFTVALGVNDMSNGAFMNSSGQSGQIVGWYSDSTSTHGFLFDGLATWTQIDYPGAQWTNGDGISNSGQIVGTYFDSSGYHGFQWNAGAPTKLDYPGAVGATQVFAINDAGQIVGYYQDSTNAWHGFLYYAGKFYPINYSGATGTFVAGINGDGVVSGYYYGSPNGFFYYPQPPTWTGQFSGPVSFAGGSGTFMYGNNNDNQLTGFTETTTGGEGLTFSNGVLFTTFQYPGQNNTVLYSANDFGQMVGTYGAVYQRLVITSQP